MRVINSLWGAETGMKKTHWIRKEILMKHKLGGGWGLKDMQFFNSALLENKVGGSYKTQIP